MLESLKSKLKALASLVERKLGIGIKVSIGLAVAALIGLSTYLATRTDANITSATVMISNIAGNHGGSGVVIERSATRSLVLTNKHVCQILKTGGKVVTTGGESHLATAYKESQVHDLCLVTVSADLKYTSKLSARSPRMYEKATISGHPNLLPNVVTEGHFSGNKVIEVLIGWKECTEKDINGPNGMACVVFGHMPLIQSYETVLVTAMIMPGSSGSAVYNSKLEISGLVFAGSGDIGFAYTVPWEFLYNFLYDELKTLDTKKPDYKLGAEAASEENKGFTDKEAMDKCRNAKNDDVSKICSLILDNLKRNAPIK